MSEKEQKDFIIKTEIMCCNKFDGTNIKTFEELLKYYEITEEIFLKGLEKKNLYDWLNNNLEVLEIPYDEYTETYYLCEISNPENEDLEYYIAKNNGTYEFTVKDILTDKTYTKKVKVTNIKNDYEYDIVCEYSSTNTKINLIDKESGIPQTFEKAYIIYNNEKIDISSCIKELETVSYINCWDVEEYLFEMDKIGGYHDILGGQVFQIEKDGITYTSAIIVRIEES